MTAWYENDDFWETVAPVLFNRERIDLAPQQVDQVIALLRLNSGAGVLDLCCGIGRHALELARRGHVVTGVDRTRAYLKRARAQAAAEDLKIEFIESDARAFRRAGAFDGAINLFTSFGYFEDPAEDLKVAENLHASLKPGARLVVDLIGKENLARRFRERDWHENTDGTLVLEDRKLRNGWDWLENRWILIKGGERKEAHAFPSALFRLRAGGAAQTGRLRGRYALRRSVRRAVQPSRGTPGCGRGKMTALIDTHCHLADPRLYGDLENVLARAHEAGVGTLLSVGAIGPIENDRRTVAIAEAHENVFAAIGVHPHDAKDCDADRIAQLRELARSKKVVAIGETGLDFHYLHSPRRRAGGGAAAPSGAGDRAGAADRDPLP